VTELAATYASIGAAIACGFLIGLEREQAGAAERAKAEATNTKSIVEPNSFGGVRTFTLLALSGGLAQIASQALGNWIVGLAFASVAAMIAISYAFTARLGSLGLTTEAAALVAFLCGVLSAQGHTGLAFAVAIATTAVLALKDWLHTGARRMTFEDVSASLKLLVIAFVVLPLLPTAAIAFTIPEALVPAFAGGGPLTIELMSPRKFGWLVLLIAAIGFLGFVAGKLLGTRKGLGLTAFLGGLVSSTAVTLSFAGRVKQAPSLRGVGLIAILLASTTMFVRVLVEVLLGIFWLRAGKQEEKGDGEDEVALKNPFRLSEAIKWSILFAVVLFLADLIRIAFGSRGLYVSGVLAGLTDVDAITLSMASLAGRAVDPLDPRTAVITITLATFSNSLVKGGMALVIGGKALGWRVLASFLLIIAVGAAGLLLI
jgi:uncharacterized membrane protein (DUF4010 family)